MAEEEVCVVKPHRACWKVNCKWGNKQPSMLPIFYSDDLVFVWTGGKNARFKEMHEGDLLLIAKGKTIDAVAEVAAPPAPLGQFTDWGGSRGDPRQSFGVGGADSARLPGPAGGGGVAL